METCENLPWAPLAVGLAIISSNVKQSCRGLHLPWACRTFVCRPSQQAIFCGRVRCCGVPRTRSPGSLAVAW